MTMRPTSTITLGGSLVANRLGYGALRVTGAVAWGDPPDRELAKAVLRRAVDLGVNFIDTAESYGPEISEDLVREALFPYPADLIIATKGGMHRFGPSSWGPDGRPERLRSDCEGSLRRLGVEQIDLYQLHQPDPDVPFLESVHALTELQSEGKIRLLGLSNVDETQLRAAQGIAEVVSIQNRYNLVDRSSERLVSICAEGGMAFIPFTPLRGASDNATVATIAAKYGVAPQQIALAFLLAHSPAMLAIPGTGSIEHVEQNCAAAAIDLDGSDVEILRSI